MGNGGFGVRNDTDKLLRIGLSMDAIHCSDNEVRHGEIFYRRPGAVWYTVFAYEALPDNEITTTKVTLGIIIVAGKIILPVLAVGGGLIPIMVTAGVPISSVVLSGAVVVVGSVKLIGDALKNVQNVFSIKIPKVSCCREGCYGGGAGTWIVVENYRDTIIMRTVNREDVIQPPQHFTKYSQPYWKG